MSEPMIEVLGLTKRYAGTLAVDHISFEVNRGEIVGLLGPNGAGKSTILRVLSCFMPATSGTVKVAGHDVFHEADEVRRRIGYMPENNPLHPEMRVREYLKFRARLKGLSRAIWASVAGNSVSAQLPSTKFSAVTTPASIQSSAFRMARGV